MYNRAQLAQKIYEKAKEEIRICETLVYEQHLQQQGCKYQFYFVNRMDFFLHFTFSFTILGAAVMANMEDLTVEFRQRFEDFYRSFDQHLSRQTEFNEFLESFNDDLEKLSRIPVLPGLMSDALQGFHGFDDIYDDNESFTGGDNSDRSRSRTISDGQDVEEPPVDEMEISEQQKARGLTLLNWISAKENQTTLQSMAESCSKGLKMFERDSISTLKANVEKIILAAQQVSKTFFLHVDIFHNFYWHCRKT